VVRCVCLQQNDILPTAIHPLALSLLLLLLRSVRLVWGLSAVIQLCVTCSAAAAVGEGCVRTRGGEMLLGKKC